MSPPHDQDSDTITEDTPLLQKTPISLAPRFNPVVPLPSTTEIHLPKVHNSYTIINLLAVIIVVASSANGFVTIPLTRLVEDAFCHQYYKEQDYRVPINEDLCKEEAIQTNVAFVLAIAGALECVVGILAALPWGIVADRYSVFS